MIEKKMTQREWDRIVGMGEIPKENKVKFTNHKSTYERHPETKNKNDKQE